MFNQIIGRLVSHIGVLFQENGVLGDLVGDFIIGIFRVFKTIGKVGMKCAGRRGFGITVTMRGGGIRGGVVRSGMVRGGVMRGRVGSGCEGQGDGNDHGSDLNKKLFLIFCPKNT